MLHIHRNCTGALTFQIFSPLPAYSSVTSNNVQIFAQGFYKVIVYYFYFYFYFYFYLFIFFSFQRIPPSLATVCRFSHRGSTRLSFFFYSFLSSIFFLFFPTPLSPATMCRFLFYKVGHILMRTHSNENTGMEGGEHWWMQS